MIFKKSKYFVISLLLLFSLNETLSEDQGGRLNELRAFFIYTLTTYVEWPASSEDYIVIGVINNFELELYLNKIAQKKKVNDKRIVIKKITGLNGIEKCHVIIIPESEKENIKKINAKVDGYPVLTIGYSSNSSNNGICVNLFNSDNKIAFEVNRKSLEKNKLKASSQMLKLAKNIY